MNELRVCPPLCGTVFSGMKLPEPSVGMSARNCELAVKLSAPALLTTAPMPVPTPGSKPGTLPDVTHGVASRPVMVIRSWIGTFVCTVPVVGFVQLVVPAHVAVVPEMLLKVSAWFVPSRPATGSAVRDGPQ